MQLLAFKTDGFKIFAAMLATTAFMGTMQATSLTTTSTVALTCNTATGLGTAGTVLVKGTAGAVVALNGSGATGGLIITAPSSQVMTASGLSYTVNMSPGCAGATAGTSAPHFQFTVGGTNDLIFTTAAVVTVPLTTGLVVSPSAVTVSCTKVSTTYTPGLAQPVLVSSAATGGIPFTVDNTTNPPASWLTVSSLTGGNAGTTPVSFTVVAASSCGGFQSGTSNTTTVHLLNGLTGTPDKTFVVTLQIVGASPLTSVVSPTSSTISYTKLSGITGSLSDVLSAGSSTYFAIDSTTLPIWLTASSAGGTTGTSSGTIIFSNTVIADTLAPGIYKANVHFKVSGFGDLTVPITLSLSNPPATLSVVEGITRNIPWIVGQPVPAPFVTLTSTDTPVPYTLTTAGPLLPTVGGTSLLTTQKGLAYSFGTQIPVAFSQLVFSAAQPGTVLTGTVTIAWGSPVVNTVVTFTIPVLSPGATISSLSPGGLPTAAPGTIFTMSLAGTGFVPSTDPTQKTKVGIVVGSTIISDSNISNTVINASNMILTINVPATTDPYLPFLQTGAGGSVTLGVCNPLGTGCSTPAPGGVFTFQIGSSPIIQGVTSASTFIEVAAPPVAPYDLISIFGTNFCSSGGTGCSSTQLLYGTPDTATLRYPLFVSPDAAGTTQRQLSVTFQTHATPPAVIATAPILFASNGQINLIAPSLLSTYTSTAVDVVVNFGYGANPSVTMLSSAAYPITVVATDPGIFTVGSDGQGEGAILAANYSLISAATPAGMHTTGSGSDTVAIYMTGLSSPNSTAANTTGGSGTVPTDCLSIANYLGALNTQAGTTVTTLDGAVIQSSLITSGRKVPCSATSGPTATIGGIAGTVTYAGWVSDSVAGLYQVNVKLPARAAGTFTNAAGTTFANLLAPVQLPVVVTTAGGVASQAKVYIWVAPQLAVSAPTAGGLTGLPGHSWSGSNNAVIATDGTSTYNYAITTGALPNGLALGQSTGLVTGIPAAGSSGLYPVTATATDSSNIPVSGAVSFTLTVGNGLFVSTSVASPYTGSAATVVASITTIQAAGGTYPYTYAITTGTTAGIAIDPNTGILGITTTGVSAGSYPLVITATDAAGVTGTISFTITLS